MFSLLVLERLTTAMTLAVDAGHGRYVCDTVRDVCPYYSLILASVLGRCCTCTYSTCKAKLLLLLRASLRMSRFHFPWRIIQLHHGQVRPSMYLLCLKWFMQQSDNAVMRKKTEVTFAAVIRVASVDAMRSDAMSAR
ncbi:hypothetical protein F4678DRAFT_329466 [Xylaria arbuscula]|nr:hypothetical protein F4678DRAFT_329466 [Xylaria arbuscula]